MVLIIRDNFENGLYFKRILNIHFITRCVCNNSLYKSSIENIHPSVILFVPTEKQSNDQSRFRKIAEEYSHIPQIAVLNSHKDTIYLPENTTTVLENDIKNLIIETRKHDSSKPEWKDRIPGIIDYITNNIGRISSTSNIVDRLCLDAKRFTDEFKLMTGKTIREYYCDEKLALIIRILREERKLGNYHNIARECGLEDDTALSHFIKRKTGKTVLEFHKELLKSI